MSVNNDDTSTRHLILFFLSLPADGWRQMGRRGGGGGGGGGGGDLFLTPREFTKHTLLLHTTLPPTFTGGLLPPTFTGGILPPIFTGGILPPTLAANNLQHLTSDA